MWESSIRSVLLLLIHLHHANNLHEILHSHRHTVIQ